MSTTVSSNTYNVHQFCVETRIDKIDVHKHITNVIFLNFSLKFQNRVEGYILEVILMTNNLDTVDLNLFDSCNQNNQIGQFKIET